MKLARYAMWAALAAAALTGCAAPSDTLYQTSTIGALLAGVYDGTVTVSQLKRHGDFGIGTFNALDGEMVVLHGRVYRIKADGKAYAAPAAARTPFATVKFFRPDSKVLVKDVQDMASLSQCIDSLLASRNLPYAVKVTGEFPYVKVRSVPRQSRPYPDLAKVVRNQPTFELRNTRGTLVGFRLPGYVEGINVPGYHFHFLTADKTAGGHVLQCRLSRARVEIDEIDAIVLQVPATKGFRQADLSGRGKRKLRKVER